MLSSGIFGNLVLGVVLVMILAVILSFVYALGKGSSSSISHIAAETKKPKPSNSNVGNSVIGLIVIVGIIILMITGWLINRI